MARTKHCIRCGCVDNGSFVAFRHSTGIRYMCAHCATAVGSYYHENVTTAGKDTLQGFTLSKEFEIPESARGIVGAAGLAYLVSVGFDVTHDGTVWVECKSPIYKNYNSWSRVSKVIESRLSVERWAADGSYGTHTNVGHERLDIDIIRKWYDTLFGRLYDTVNAAPDEVKKAMFGRAESGWAVARLYRGADYAHTHGIMWNVEHNTHMELRINKYTSYEQDKRATKYAMDTVAALVDFCDEVKNNRATLNGDALIKANRKSADKAGRRIDNVFRKHANLPRVNATRGYESRR